MKKTFLINIFREIWKSKSRFLSIFLIVALGTGFYSGLKASAPDMIFTAENYFEEYNLYDLHLYRDRGFTEEDINLINEINEVSEIEKRYQFDYIYDNNHNVFRIISSQDYASFCLLKGKFPEKENEVLISEDGYQIGEKIIIDNPSLEINEFIISGIVMSPEYLSYNYGRSIIGDGKIDFYLVVSEAVFQFANYTDLYLHLKTNYRGYDKNYFSEIDKVKLSFANLDVEIYDRRNIEGYLGFQEDVDKVEQISKVIPLFFILITVLITLTTMTRMIAEQRLEIGTLSALGYNKLEISGKYFIYAFICTFLGTVIGVGVGLLIMPRIVFNAYDMTYILPPLDFQLHIDYLLISLLVSTLSTMLAVFIACFHILKTVPSQLMRGKSPVAGKKIVLERIKFLWNKISFNFKMTLRNIFRYKRRTLITIIGICGCAGLMLTGFGLRNAIINVSDQQFSKIFTYDGYALINPYAEINLDYPEIDSSLKIYQNNYQIKAEEDLFITIIVPEDVNKLSNFITLKKRNNHKLTLDDEGVIITEKYAQILKLKIGDKITIFDYQNREIIFPISGITENYLHNYLYISPNLYQEHFGLLYYNFILLHVNDNEVFQKMKGEPGILSTALLSETEDYFSESTNNLAFVIVIIILASGLLAFIVLSNLANINITERAKELTTFKVLGMHDYEISLYIARENYFSTIVGLGFGLLIGVYFEKYVISIIESNEFMLIQDIDFFSYLYTSLLTIAFSLIVNFLLHYKIKRLDIVSAMKAIE